MREHISRGKRVDNGEWIYWNRYGRLTDINGEPTKIEINTSALRPYAFYVNELPVIREETVGQYTGLTYKGGRKIFEGDIIRTNCNEIGVIRRGEYDVYSRYVFGGYYCIDKTSALIEWTCGWHCEVIGNIHDNPELLEENKQCD